MYSCITVDPYRTIVANMLKYFHLCWHNILSRFWQDEKHCLSCSRYLVPISNANVLKGIVQVFGCRVVRGTLVSVLPAVDGCQLGPCVETQCVAQAGKQSVGPLRGFFKGQKCNRDFGGDEDMKFSQEQFNRANRHSFNLHAVLRLPPHTWIMLLCCASKRQLTIS